MDRDARRYARWVLLIHVALFGAVLLIIAYTARVLYRGAYEQAIGQATITQEMLARQTGLSIQNYYGSITAVLELLQLPENEPAPRRDGPRGSLDDAPFVRVVPTIWASLSERVSLLFVVDPRAPKGAVKVLGANPDAPAPRDVQEHLAAWVGDVRRASVSPYVQFSQGGGAHVVWKPLRAPHELMLVAVVPIAKVEQALLRDVNNRSTAGAMLTTEDGVIVSHSRPELVGKNVLTDILD